MTNISDDASLHKKSPINKHQLKFATLPKRQFRRVHVYVTYL